MFIQNRILMDKADDSGSASGYGTEAATSTETATQTQAQGDSSNSTSTDAAGAAATKDQSTASDDKSKQASEEDVTGYNNKTDDKGDTKDKVVTDDKPLELDSKGLEEAEMAGIQDFAKAHKLSKDQAQALVDKIKSQNDSMTTKQAEMKAAEAEVYKKWEGELKADPDFGGQNFDQNVHNVNKLIREELPGLKNLLTSAGKRLPPSVMKDLNNVARKLYGETEFNQGDKAGDKSNWHPTDFYKQKQ